MSPPTATEDFDDAARVALMEQVFSSVEEVCAQLSPADWDRTTDCPGWSVKDNLSHLASFEAVATGTPPVTEVDVSHLTHVLNDVGAMNEREVEVRRSLSPDLILSEFRAATAKRLKQLADLDDEGWTSPMTTPVGAMEQRGGLPIRILDVFFHEQDIRRATDRPGHMDGDVARFVYAWMSSRPLLRVVGKNAPDGATVAFDIASPGWPVAIAVADGKGALAPAPAGADVRFATDLDTFLRVLGGRLSAERARTEGRMSIQGDEAIARAILDNIVVVP